MAVIYSGISSPIHGKVGPVVGTNRRCTHVVKSAPVPFKNDSVSQRYIHSRYSSFVSFASAMKHTLPASLYKGSHPKLSYYHYLFTLAFSEYISTGELHNLYVLRGSLSPITLIDIDWYDATGFVYIYWNKNLTVNGSPNDLVSIVAYHTISGRVFESEISAHRSKGYVYFKYDKNLSANDMCCWAFVYEEKASWKRRFSNSFYFKYLG
jgi:hypothetical protein